MFSVSHLPQDSNKNNCPISQFNRLKIVVLQIIRLHIISSFQSDSRRESAWTSPCKLERLSFATTYVICKLSENDIFKGLKNDKLGKDQHHYLKKNIAEDREFLKEVHLLNLIADKVSSSIESDGTPDLFWFKVSSLHPLVHLYGDNSTKVKEAKQLINEAILHLNNAFKKTYKGAVLFSVLTSDIGHTRRARSILADEPGRDLNLAANYSADYPVIFNIILWLCIILGFSLLAIALVIGDMDPGRDSIIYRMTNPRMKKDN